jgi:hypothetical protein
MRIQVPYNMIDVDEDLTGNSECRSKGQSVPDITPPLGLGIMMNLPCVQSNNVCWGTSIRFSKCVNRRVSHIAVAIQHGELGCKQ